MGNLFIKCTLRGLFRLVLFVFWVYFHKHSRRSQDDTFLSAVFLMPEQSLPQKFPEFSGSGSPGYPHLPDLSQHQSAVSSDDGEGAARSLIRHEGLKSPCDLVAERQR